ncbi:MAG TPA: hypothetical protein VEK07_13025 [Polyangiaceae bacterium]|nr:hypothetical protein [Polyangiaceae bacterium]
MNENAKMRLIVLTREQANRAGGIQTILGQALDLLADKFESLVTDQRDADRLLDEANCADATWDRIQEVKRRLVLDGRSEAETTENLQRHAVLWVRQHLVLEESRGAYDNVIRKIAYDFRRGSQP